MKPKANFKSRKNVPVHIGTKLNPQSRDFQYREKYYANDGSEIHELVQGNLSNSEENININDNDSFLNETIDDYTGDNGLGIEAGIDKQSTHLLQKDNERKQRGRPKGSKNKKGSASQEEPKETGSNAATVTTGTNENVSLTNYNAPQTTQTVKDSFFEQVSNEMIVVNSANEMMTIGKSQPKSANLFDFFWLQNRISLLFGHSTYVLTSLAMTIVDSLTKGKPITGFNMDADAQPVLYIEGKISAKSFESRYSNNSENPYKFSDYLIIALVNLSNYVEGSFSTIHDYFVHAIEEIIIQKGTKILVLNNLSSIWSGYQSPKKVEQLMTRLEQLRKKYGLSILVVDHLAKHKSGQPLELPEVYRSGLLANTIDSAFCVGISSNDDNIIYIKQIEIGNDRPIYGKRNVVVSKSDQGSNFPVLEFTNYGKEEDIILKSYSNTAKEYRNQQIIDLHEQNKSSREIARILDICHMTVLRAIKEYNRLVAETGTQIGNNGDNMNDSPDDDSTPPENTPKKPNCGSVTESDNFPSKNVPPNVPTNTSTIVPVKPANSSLLNTSINNADVSVKYIPPNGTNSDPVNPADNVTLVKCSNNVPAISHRNLQLLPKSNDGNIESTTRIKDNISIKNIDCIHSGFASESVDLLICDPPFGIGEGSFNKTYNRKVKNVIEGYKEAPEDYDTFTFNWMKEAYRVLKSDGSMFIVSGWSKSNVIHNNINKLGFHLINKIAWNFDFAQYTRNKFNSSHYDIFYVCKNTNRYKFIRSCRFDCLEMGINEKGKKYNKLYKDMSDVWQINRENRPNEAKNMNKLPEELILKMLLYSSNEGDTVGDFFMGNFTTAIVAKKNNRNVVGCELNPNAFTEGMKKLDKIMWGQDIQKNRPKEDKSPVNQGKRLSYDNKKEIKERFENYRVSGIARQDAIIRLCSDFGRGKIAIINILKKSAA